MTIVLQHQFWDLSVGEDFLRGRPVVLQRSRTAARALRRPVPGFFDPSVQFGLKFEPADAATEAPTANLPGRPRPLRPAGCPAPAAGRTETKDEPAKPSEGAEVVRLDRFRKK